MRLPDVDWSVLRGSLILGVFALAASVALVGGGQWFHKETQARFDKEQRRFQTNSRRYLAVDEEERLIATHLPSYRKLEQSGVVGEEQRLAWIETLREVSASVRLPSMRYEIQPQKEYQPPVASPPVACGCTRAPCGCSWGCCTRTTCSGSWTL